MRIFKLIGVLVCALAVSAVAVSTASANIKPGSGTFTGKSGKATLQVKGGASITCPKSTASGEITSETSGKGTITFGGSCTTAGLPVNSLGDAGGTILTPVAISACEKSPEILLLKLESPLHLEVPSTKLLLVIEGGAYAEVSPINANQTEFKLIVTQAGGKNAIETCNKAKNILTTSTDGGEFIQSGEEAKEATLTFAAAHEFA